MKNILISGLSLLLSSSLMANDFDDFSASESKGAAIPAVTGFEFSGSVDVEQGANISGAGPHAKQNDNFVMANRRLRLKTSKNNSNGGIYAKVDFVKDDVINDTYLDVRELRLQYTPLSWMDLSIGRQVSTWGVGDMIFINDLFPKNWIAHFQGRDMEMLKDPSDSARITSYFGDTTFDVVYTPQFSPDTTPNGCYFNVYDPNSQGLIANNNGCSATRDFDKKDRSFKNSEWAASLKRNFFGQQVALYYYRGFFKNPKGLDYDASQSVGEQYSAIYPKLEVYGASTEGQIGPGIFTAEYGYYNSKDDTKGDDMMIENSLMKYLLGYRMDLSAHWSVGAQVYQEWMQDYDKYESSIKAGNPNAYPYRRKEFQNTYTLRLTYKAQQETLWVNLFSYYRPEDKDSFTKFDITKKLNDNFSATAGVNIFTGKDHYQDRDFGMLRHDDNAFVRLSYSL